MPRRRANNEGTVSRHARGWVAAYFDGEGRRRYLYAKTRAAAGERLVKALEERRVGRPPDDARLTVAKLLTEWLEEKRGGVRPSTYACYEPQVRLHLIPSLGKNLVAKLQGEQLTRYYAKQMESGLSPRTVLLHHRILHMALDEAMRRGKLARNVAGPPFARPPRQLRPPVQVLTAPDANRLLEQVRGNRLEALFVTALATGLRRGELCALRWEDLDLDEGLLRVQHTLTHDGNQWIRTEPKTASSRRVVRLPSVATEALKKHRVRQAEERLKAGVDWLSGGYVFATEVGAPLDGQNLLRRFRTHLKRAGLPAITFHTLRHCTASFLLAQGVHPKVVAEMLGHSEVGTTLNTYSHLLPHLQEEAATKLDSVLRLAEA